MAAVGQCTGRDGESFGRYQTGNKRRASCFEKREAAVNVKAQDRICRTGPFLIRDDQKTTLRFMESVIRKEEVLGSDGKMAMDLVKLLETYAMGIFVLLLRDIVEERWEKRVDNDACLEFVKSGYVLVCICPS